MTVRAARFQDIPAITGILRDAYERSIYADSCTFDETECKSILRQAMGRLGHQNYGGTMAIVSERDGAVQGFLLGMFDHVYPGLKELSAKDLFFVMAPGAGWDAPRMLRHLIRWAEKNPKCIEVHVGVTDALVDYRRAARLYERLGLLPCGAMLARRFDRSVR